MPSLAKLSSITSSFSQISELIFRHWNSLLCSCPVLPEIYLKGIANYHCLLFSSRMSNAQIFNQISDQNALFLMERGAVGRIIFVVFWLLDSLGLERTRKWFVTDIMYLKMRNAEYWSENDSIGE